MDEVTMIDREGSGVYTPALPEERCETCDHYRFRFIHGCMRTGRFEACPPDVKCPFYKKKVGE